MSQNDYTWDEANQLAKTLTIEVDGVVYTGKLATINSGFEQDVVNDLLANEDTPVWIGGRRQGNDNKHEWITNEPFVYTNWNPQEPTYDYIKTLRGEITDYTVFPYTTTNTILGYPIHEDSIEIYNNGKWNDTTREEYPISFTTDRWYTGDITAFEYEISKQKCLIEFNPVTPPTISQIEDIEISVLDQAVITNENLFYDVNADLASWNIESSNPSIVSANYIDNRLILSVIDPQATQTTITLSAIDRQNNTTTSTFNVKTNPMSQYMVQSSIDGTYYLPIHGIFSWDDANQLARSLSFIDDQGVEQFGRLVTINSEEENQFLVSDVITEGNQYWIGAKRNSEDAFEWVSQENFSYLNWAPGEPSNVIETVAEMHDNGLWNDITPINEKCFIVEFYTNNVPFVKHALNDLTISYLQPTTIDVTSYFGDQDRDISQYTAASSNKSILNATIDCSMLTLVPVIGQTGEATIIVKAIDSENNSVDSSFTVSVVQPLVNPDNGHIYGKYVSQMTWEDANAFCDSIEFTDNNGWTYGAHLAAITSVSEQKFIEDNFLEENDRLWLGAYRVDSTDEFAWVTGEDFLYLNWSENQPSNDDGIENVVEMNWKSDPSKYAKWNDVPSSYQKSFMIEIEVTSAAPVAHDIDARLLEDETISIAASISDPDQNTHTISIVHSPSNGNVTINNGRMNYQPDPDFFGEDSFTYMANDGELDSNTATVSLIITPVNDAPEFESLGYQFTNQTTAADQTYWVEQVTTDDLDQDGDQDILAAGRYSGDIDWYENTGGFNFVLHRIDGSYGKYGSSGKGAYDVSAFDVDNDGDLDLLGAIYEANEVSWYENDGMMNFEKHIISSNAAGALAVNPVDIDNDSDIDVVAASNSDNSIRVFKNDGSQQFTETVISSSEAGAIDVKTADLNGDGLIDVISAGYYSNVIAWFENTDGSSFIRHEISASADGLEQIDVIDIDLDGDIDLLSASSADGYIRLFLNDGGGLFDETIITTNLPKAVAVQAEDIDLDGDIDIGAASTQDQLVWFENIGDHQFVEHPIQSSTGNARSLAFADLNNDGAAEFIVNSLNWHEIHFFEGHNFKTQQHFEAGLTSIPNFISDISAGPSNESDQQTQIHLIVENPNLFVSPPVVDSDGTLTYQLNGNEFGSSSVSLLITDNGGTANGGVDASDSISFSIQYINHFPIANNIIASATEDHAMEFSLSAIDKNNDPIIYSIVDLPVNGILSGDAPVLTYTPNEDFYGVDTLTYFASDSLGDGNIATVTINVTPVNDAPSAIVAVMPQAVRYDAGIQNVTGVITDLSAGPVNEASQVLSVTTTNSNPELFDVQPQVSLDGTLTYSPADGAVGDADVFVVLQDDGGVADGGVDSATYSFSLTILDAPAKVIVLNAAGAGVAGATVQYKDGSWMDLPGVTDSNGEIELPVEWSGRVALRVFYADTLQTQTINLDTTKEIVFQAVNVNVSLISSGGAPIVGEEAIVEYYQSGWKQFGATNLGSVSLEMLPNNYRFRMTYANGRSMITQNVGNNAYVVFQTWPVSVSLVDSTGAPIATPDSEVLYRGVEWISMGDLSGGVVYDELLPATYRFRVNYASATAEIRQNIKFDSEVNFQTKNVRIELNGSDGNPISGADATVEFNSGGWNNAGEMVDGVLSLELLPKTYNFRLTYQDSTKTKSQNVHFNSTVAFNTVKFTTELRDSLNEFIADENATVKYYSRGWQDFGETLSGSVSKELMPNIYNFRIEYASASADQKNDYFQDVVTFNTEQFTVELRDSSEELFVDADGMVKYNSGGWWDFGVLENGVATKELLPRVYTFRMEYANASQDLKNDDVDPLTVSFYTKNVTVQLKDAAGLPLEDDVEVKYTAGGWQDFGTSSEGAVSAELLPKTYAFRLYYKGRYVQQNADVINPETMVNFQTGQVKSLSDTAVLVNSGGWIEFLQNMELLPGNYNFKFEDNHRTTYTIDSGFINTIE